MFDWLSSLALLVGFVLIFKTAFAIGNFVYVHFFRPGQNLKKFGSWAIVTGSTDGIGQAIAQELAAKGLNLVLISRTQEKLERDAKELSTKFNIQTKVVAVDFSQNDPNLLNPVRDAIRGLDIGILVNNVGASYDHAEYFHLVEAKKIDDLIRINIEGTTKMTYLVLPDMVERKKGAIVNVSSASSMVNEPLYAVYSASKAYVNTFSTALHYEYRGRGVHVQAQIPAFVVSKLSKLRSANFFIVTPRAYAKAFIKMIGYEPVIFSYWTHSLQIETLLALPIPWSVLCPFLLNRGLGIRKKAYAKKQQK